MRRQRNDSLRFFSAHHHACLTWFSLHDLCTMPLSSRSTTPTPLVIVPPVAFDASPARSSPHSAGAANGATTPTRRSPELPKIALPEYTGISPQRSTFQQEYASDEAEVSALPHYRRRSATHGLLIRSLKNSPAGC